MQAVLVLRDGQRFEHMVVSATGRIEGLLAARSWRMPDKRVF